MNKSQATCWSQTARDRHSLMSPSGVSLRPPSKSTLLVSLSMLSLCLSLNHVSCLNNEMQTNKVPLTQTIVPSRAANLQEKTTPKPGENSGITSVGASNQISSPPTVRSLMMPVLRTESNLKNPSASSTSSWIEKILIHVEDINLRNERVLLRKQQVKSKSIVDADADDQPLEVSSLSPTDSDEDILEATSTLSSSMSTSSDALKNQKLDSTSRYGYSNPVTISTGDMVAIEAPTDEEQRLVESNNVSAVLSKIEDRPRTGSTTNIPQQLHNHVQISCEQAYTQCALRKVCAPTLKAYNDECSDLISNQTNVCSEKCLRSMIALRSSEEGENLARCDCEGNDFCNKSKQRSLICESQVDRAIEPKSIVSCSTASAICMADQLCSTALDYYYRNCQSLFSQRHCSLRCNNSLSILYRQPKAYKLINCVCDGSEEFPCMKYKTYTERLCLNKLSLPADDGLPDESSNVTTDDLQDQQNTLISRGDVTLSASGDINDAADSESDEERLEYDSRTTEGDSGDNTNNFSLFNTANEDNRDSNSNGIQPVEDNWIPLMSGRYFTNLHRRSQQKQVSPDEPELKVGNSALQPNQNSRRPKPRVFINQRNGRHRNLTRTSLANSQNRRWYGNIVTLASSASVGSSSMNLPPLVVGQNIMFFITLSQIVNWQLGLVYRLPLLL